MVYEKIKIEKLGYSAFLQTYILDNSEEIDSSRVRPMVIICPGGAYRYTSDREAEPIAVQMNAMGMHAAVLRYSCQPAPFAAALLQLCEAVRLMREHAKEWHIDSGKIVVAGGSAGGHLAASLGAFWDKEFLSRRLGISNEMIKPNGLVLSYPVIRVDKALRENGMQIIPHQDWPELNKAEMLDENIGPKMPPVFAWHTARDELVTVKNSFYLAEKLEEYKIPFELHIYPLGGHGLSLGTEETFIDKEQKGIQREVQNWISMAGRWIRNLDDLKK